MPRLGGGIAVGIGRLHIHRLQSFTDFCQGFKGAISHQPGEEGGLPGTFGTDEVDFVPALKVKRHAAEEGAAGVGFADLSD